MTGSRVRIVQTAYEGQTGIVMSVRDHFFQVRLSDGRNIWFAHPDLEVIR